MQPSSGGVALYTFAGTAWDGFLDSELCFHVRSPRAFLSSEAPGTEREAGSRVGLQWVLPAFTEELHFLEKRDQGSTS